MSESSIPLAILAEDVTPRTRPSIYPEPFAVRMTGREKRQLGEIFGLTHHALRFIPSSRCRDHVGINQCLYGRLPVWQEIFRVLVKLSIGCSLISGFIADGFLSASPDGIRQERPHLPIVLEALH